MSSLSRRNIASRETGSTRKRFEQGIRLQAQDRHVEAVSRFRKVVAGEPDHMDALKGLVESLIATQRAAEATRLLDERAECVEESHKALSGLASICLAINYSELGETLLRRILKLAPADPVALLNLAGLHEQRGEAQEAVDLVSQVIEKEPDAKFVSAAYSALGRILAGRAMYEEAEAAYRHAIELQPDSMVGYTNLAGLYETLGRNDEALLFCERALRLDPESDGTRWNLARALLAAGHLEEGWDMYGFGFACHQRTPYRPFPGLIWEGEDLTDKTLMVWREQGIGDDLYFSTCYHDLVREAGHLIIETDPRLVPLYQRTWPEATVRAESRTSTGLDNYGKVDFDFTAPAGIVASHRRRSLDSFPENPPLLIADPERRKEARDWLATLGPGPRIGFCWRSSVQTHVRTSFATKLEDWADLLTRDDIQMVNLQYGAIDEEIAEVAARFNIRLHRMPGLDTMNDLEGTAALTAELDFFVAQWNASSEMAGALGIPGVIYLAKSNPVMLGTNRMPWHPCLHPFPITPGFDPLALTRAMTDKAMERLRAAGKF